MALPNIRIAVSLFVRSQTVLISHVLFLTVNNVESVESAKHILWHQRNQKSMRKNFVFSVDIFILRIATISVGTKCYNMNSRSQLH